MKARLSVALAVCLALVSAGAAGAKAQTSVTITPSLAPDQLGARSSLTLTAHFAAPAGGLPAPVRKAVLRLPAGLTLDIPRLRSCNAARLEAFGPAACPGASRLGGGSAVVEGLIGSTLVDEPVSLSSFLGPLNDRGEPTFLVFGQGTAPIATQLLMAGTGVPDRAPYGERLTMTIPSLPTVPPGPDASVTHISMTIGSSAGRLRRHANAVLVPGRCPRGGFPFAARFLYADGSSGEARASAPCPKRRRRSPMDARPASARRHAHVARTLQLSENAHLRLTSRKGFTLNERGSVSGTVAGTIYVHLKIVSSSRVTAEVNIYRPGGSIAGYATAGYKRGFTQGAFSGTLAIVRGTGAYANAKALGLRFSGTIYRSSYAIAVRVSGRATL